MEEISARYIVTVDEKEYDIMLSPMEQYGKFKIEFGDKSYTVQADELSNKKFLFKINNMSSEVDLDRKNDYMDVFLEGKEMTSRVEPYYLAELRKKAGASAGGPSDTTIKAPMPGLILSVEVKPGDTVAKGATLCIIEAMKMENLIKSPFDGVVKSVNANKGEAVEKNHKLIEFE